ncbi:MULTISPECIES: carbohydrate ABC transporter permease [Streptosporangium]|uniref:Transmembrane binding-protein-dependent transporter n=1 Tax=Streptosporangium roseum (strain ATCC 12428 / DSM 43021 / JCM 3005 / KCTC 9067 / NCIMB 10171 / NRRL 2505 / NI 9100) TaxID=479432 RepID=D2B239_STRRD|nr:sugar ABC transporter permease [Streptosporangium roseum]ACZ89263.1 putative transmembrane binding-protein-dependent transporter [Streptosporangium roseum DSM 43021]
MIGRKAPPGRRRIPWGVYLVLLPTFAALAVFAYYPALSGMLHSLYEWRPGFTSPFVGLENYVTMFGDDLWWASFRNIGIIFVWAVTLMWVFPLLAAELVMSLSSERLRFVFRTLLILPLAFPAVVNVLLWQFMYDPRDGVVNSLLRAVGLDGLASNWIGDPDTALTALMTVGFPWVASLPFLVFLSALQNVPAEIYQAAEVDGAGRLRRLWSIDLPMMLRDVKLLLVMAVIAVLQYGMQAHIMTKGGPDNATQVPVLRMLDAAFLDTDWGYAAALGTVLFVLTLAVSVGALLAGRRGGRNARA